MITRYKEIISKLIGCGYAEVEQLIEIMEYQPMVIQAAKERAEEIGKLLDWGDIIESLSNLTKDSVDYKEIANEIHNQVKNIPSGEVIDECNILEEYINSIEIDNNGSAWGGIAYAKESKYSDAGELFKKILYGEITSDEFHEEVSSLMVEIIKEERVEEELEPVGVYTISNNHSILIFEINTDEDIVIAGPSWEDREECSLDGDTFKFGEIEIPLDECMRY